MDSKKSKVEKQTLKPNRLEQRIEKKKRNQVEVLFNFCPVSEYAYVPLFGFFQIIWKDMSFLSFVTKWVADKKQRPKIV